MRRFELVLLVGIAQLGCTEDDKTEDTGTSSSSAFAETGLDDGNDHHPQSIRRDHGITTDLVWDEYLAEVSLEWLEHLAENNGCQMEHNWDSPLGENLMWATYYMSAADVVNGWASEEAFMITIVILANLWEKCVALHKFVWESTERVGCAMIVCPNGTDHMWMCNYDPAGNWVGERPY